jgi:enoyl-CoA hydratase/carnithine racemase
MKRHNGILEMVLHTNNGPLEWGYLPGTPGAELAHAFGDVSRDPDNKVVILTGSGNKFSGPEATRSMHSFPRSTAKEWELIQRTGVRLIMNFLDIEAPVISCINGPAPRHSELPLLADIVLASDDATIQDSGHFINRVTPGDGMGFVMPLLLGMNRARYYLLTGQTLDAPKLQEIGLVNEVMPRERLLPRAHELAERLVQQNSLVLHFTRQLFTQQLKRMAHESLGLGFALEGLAVIDEGSTREDRPLE